MQSIHSITTTLSRLDLDLGIPEEKGEEVIEQLGNKIPMSKRLKRRVESGNRRAEYMPVPVFLRNSVGGPRFETALAGRGTFQHIAAALGEKLSPVYKVLFQMDDPQPDGSTRKVLDSQNLERLAGIKPAVVFDTKWVLRKGSKIWQLASRAMPNATEMAAYGTSFCSPVVYNGFLVDAEITLATVTDWQGNPAGCDGSGWISSTHRIWKQLGIKPCVIQVRFINVQGTLCKGILVPTDKLKGDEIIFDWMQVKGAKKDDAKKWAKEGKSFKTAGFLSVIQCFNKHKPSMNMSGQFLEKIRMEDETVAAVHNMVDRSMAELKEGGLSKLLDRLQSDDRGVTPVGMCIRLLRHKGWDDKRIARVDFVHEFMLRNLERKLYRIASGTGVTGKQFVLVIDNALKNGEVVADGFRCGTEVVLWKYPMPLPQVIQVVKVIRPHKNMSVRDERGKKHVVQNACFMNLWTSKLLMGDDDGDLCALSDDPDVLVLAKNKISERVLMIEPNKSGDIGIASTDTIQAQKFWMQPRGQEKGQQTLIMNRLYALGNNTAAEYAAVGLQEVLDTKHYINMTNPYKLSQDSWIEVVDEEGNRYFKLKDGLGTARDWDFKPWSDWYRGLAPKTEEGKTIEPLTWRHRNRRVNLGKWEPCEIVGRGNLIHECYNYTHEVWMRDVRQAFELGDEPKESVCGLMAELVPEEYKEAATPEWIRPDGKVNQNLLAGLFRVYWDGLRRKSGLSAWAESMGKALRAFDGGESDTPEEMGSEDEKKLNLAIQHINTTLMCELMNLTTEELLTVFKFEASGFEGELGRSIIKADIRKAFRAICWDGSPVITLLGIKGGSNLCHYMDGALIKEVVSDAAKRTEPFERMMDWINKDLDHQHKEGIPLKDCQTCTSKLEHALVSKKRECNHGADIREAKEWLALMRQVV